MKTGSEEVFEETTIKMLIMGRPLGLAIIAVVWILGGLMAIIIGGGEVYKVMANSEEISSYGGAFVPLTYLWGIILLVIGIFLILIGIGLWQSRRKAWFIAVCSLSIVLISYITWNILRLMGEISGEISDFLPSLITKAFMPFLISLIYLLIKRSSFKYLNQ